MFLRINNLFRVEMMRREFIKETRHNKKFKQAFTTVLKFFRKYNSEYLILFSYNRCIKLYFNYIRC